MDGQGQFRTDATSIKATISITNITSIVIDVTVKVIGPSTTEGPFLILPGSKGGMGITSISVVDAEQAVEKQSGNAQHNKVFPPTSYIHST